MPLNKDLFNKLSNAQMEGDAMALKELQVSDVFKSQKKQSKFDELIKNVPVDEGSPGLYWKNLSTAARKAGLPDKALEYEKYGQAEEIANMGANTKLMSALATYRNVSREFLAGRVEDLVKMYGEENRALIESYINEAKPEKEEGAWVVPIYHLDGQQKPILDKNGKPVASMGLKTRIDGKTTIKHLDAEKRYEAEHPEEFVRAMQIKQKLEMSAYEKAQIKIKENAAKAAIKKAEDALAAKINKEASMTELLAYEKRLLEESNAIEITGQEIPVKTERRLFGANKTIPFTKEEEEHNKKVRGLKKKFEEKIAKVRQLMESKVSMPKAEQPNNVPPEGSGYTLAPDGFYYRKTDKGYEKFIGIK